MNYKNIHLKKSYVSMGNNNIVDSFLNPMLECTKLYRRSVGFFSSSAFQAVKNGIIALARNRGKLKLIASPNLSAEDIEAINMGYKKREEIIEEAFSKQFIEELTCFEDEDLNIMASLIANNIMDIKLAVTSSNGIYHDKLGLCEDFDGNIVAFYGSANSSFNAYNNNYEKIRISRNWINGEADTVYEEVKEFDALWDNENPYVSVYEYTEIVKKNIINVIESRKQNKKMIIQ